MRFFVSGSPFFYYKWVSPGHEWAALVPIAIVLSGWAKVPRHGPSDEMRTAMLVYRDQLARGRTGRARRAAEVTAATVEAAGLASNPAGFASAAGGLVAEPNRQ